MKLKSIEQIKREFKHSHNPGCGIDLIDYKGLHINEEMICLFDKEYKDSDFIECNNDIIGYDYRYRATKYKTWYFSKDWFESKDFITIEEFQI